MTRIPKASTAHTFGGPGTGLGGKDSPGRGHPIMYGEPSKARRFYDPFPEGGGYPKGFIKWACRMMECDDPDSVLHLCSGSVLRGTTLDVREEKRPNVVADCRRTPFRDECFDYILIDPPYSKEYARNLYDTERVYPAPGVILREAARLLRPGGKVGLLHFQVPVIRRPLKMLGVYGVTTGSGYAIRAWTLLHKQPNTE